jgi:hypothetical protein
MLRTPLLIALAVLAATPAFAQGEAPQGPENLGVMDRERPDYDAKGLPLGAFRLKPSLDVNPNLDDNVFDTETGAEEDIYWTINPSFTLESDWARHALNFTGSLTRYEYMEEDSENRTDWTVGAEGRIDVLRGTMIEGEAAYLNAHEPRYSSNEPGLAAAPTEFSQFHAAAAITHQPNRFGIQIGGGYDRFRFDDTELLGGGSFSNEDRDEQQYNAFIKASYEFQPGTAVFIRGSYDDQNFELELDRDGVNRDSQRFRADIGASFFATRLIRGEVFVGYVEQRFHAPLPDVSAFDYGAQIDWYVSELFTLHVKAARVMNDTTITGASVSDDQTGSISFDWELLRNVLVHGGVDYVHSKFRGTDRDDELFGAGASVDYLINEYLALHAGYRYIRRNSSVAGEDFDDNVFYAGLRFQL